MYASQVTVNTSATVVVAADDWHRFIYLHNLGGGKIYLGGADVTTSSGYPLDNGQSLSVAVPAGERIYGCVSTGTATLAVLQPNLD